MTDENQLVSLMRSGASIMAIKTITGNKGTENLSVLASPYSSPHCRGSQPENRCRISLLTGGGDKPYALGLAAALLAQGIRLDFIGSDEVNSPFLHDNSQEDFLNFRGEQARGAGWLRKALRVMRYYLRLVRYAAAAKLRVFHILWNNKFELFDRTVLMV